jgi:hypothetical protein
MVLDGIRGWIRMGRSEVVYVSPGEYDMVVGLQTVCNSEFYPL